MLKADKYCKETIENILNNGFLDENPRPHYKDGTPAHTLSVNQIVHRFDISKGEFPIITLRPIAWKNSVKEILWIYQDASNDLNILEDKYDIHWWNEWDVGDRTIGKRYGHTVKRFDLMNKLLTGLIENPFGRRHEMSLWQNIEFEEDPDALNPCAFLTMWNVRKVPGEDTLYLDMTLVQRSSDYLTAGCINQMQYVALLLMVAKHCGYKPGVFVHYLQNVQIYDRHIKNEKIMFERESIDCHPVLLLDTDKTSFYDFTIDDFKLVDYPLSTIKETNPQLIFELGI